MKELKRGAGILLSITSLPSKYGIGTLGAEAYRFVDMLLDLKQKYWQVLPLGPTGAGDSPYQAFSAFAGNPYIIDLETLVEDGLLTIDQIEQYFWGSDEHMVDYPVLFENRVKVLKEAFHKFDISNSEYISFIKENSYWLYDYSLFMSLKEKHDYAPFTSWEEKYKKHDEEVLSKFARDNSEQISFWSFVQFEFFKQWALLKEYANIRGIEIIGEVPLFVAGDSADVWAHSSLFRINDDWSLDEVAGCPPDAFSDGGQKWGNPLYNWEVMEKDNFDWWYKRIQTNASIYDVIRINHFVGIVKEYSVPYDHKDASKGKWRKGPGKKLTDVIEKAAGDTIIIAEDFGTVVIPTVRKLINKLGWAGMKVLLFAFEEDPKNDYLPHNYTDTNCVVYGTTHDSDTIVGYFKDKSDYQNAFLYEYLGINSADAISDAFIRLAYSSIANVVIIQMQDMLGLGNEARMNYPATVGLNWRWRLWHDAIPEDRRAWFRTIATIYRR